MKAIRYSTEQKIRILREAEGSGKKIQDVCRDHQISEQTFYRWKREFGMLEISHAKRTHRNCNVKLPDSSVCWPMRCSEWSY